MSSPIPPGGSPPPADRLPLAAVTVPDSQSDNLGSDGDVLMQPPSSEGHMMLPPSSASSAGVLASDLPTSSGAHEPSSPFSTFVAPSSPGSEAVPFAMATSASSFSSGLPSSPTSSQMIPSQFELTTSPSSSGLMAFARRIRSTRSSHPPSSAEHSQPPSSGGLTDGLGSLGSLGSVGFSAMSGFGSTGYGLMSDALTSDPAAGQTPGPSDASQPTPAGTGDMDDSIAQSVIWGTTIHLRDAWSAFHTFLRDFTAPAPGMPDHDPTDLEGAAWPDPYYSKLLDQVVNRGLSASASTGPVSVLSLNCAHLRQFSDASRTLYRQLLTYPREVVSLMDAVALECVSQLCSARFGRAIGPDHESLPRVQVRPFNLENRCDLRALNPRDIDKLVSIRGLVIRTGSVIPDLKTAFFRCTVCHFSSRVAAESGGRITEPTRCPRCYSSQTMELVYNRCEYADKQLVRIQETPDEIPHGQTPHTVSLVAFDDNVDVPRPGDRVEVTGIYRAAPIRLSPRERVYRSVYRTYVDVLHYRLVDRQSSTFTTSSADSKGQDPQNERPPVFIPEAIKPRLVSIGARPDVLDVLTRSLAPSVHGHEDVKRGLLCQLVGGTHKTFTRVGGGRFRGDINILMCGDPGTSKSQLLRYVHQIAPRGIYTSGRGSSAVGLTAYVTRDPETGLFVLESGALVLSDGGICCIDEFDKMSESARSVLHEVMEQQTVSIAKAGIICQLNARTSLLAAANPVKSRYDPSLSIVQNIQLPPSLTSRFDLIYIILDYPDARSDRRLAEHIIGLYQPQGQPRATTSAEDIQAPDLTLDAMTLSSYIAYARQHIHPVISDDAGQDLIAGYVELRAMGGKNVFTASPRALESLIRLSEAHAKLRLGDTVTPNDVAAALKLHKAALRTYALDPATGRLDLDLAYTGRSAASREAVPRIVRGLLSYVQNCSQEGARASSGQALPAVGQAWPFALLFREFRSFYNQRELTLDTFREALLELAEQGAAIVPPGYSSITFT